MVEAPASPFAAMEGHGFYNQNSAMQAVGVSHALSIWERACQSVAVGPEPLVIADYASSQGRNSMRPVRMAIDAVRRLSGDKPVEVFHTDLPSNDFTSLFTALDQNSDSYLQGLTGVFPAAIGRSYFEPLFPPGRVHLGWNTWSMQWMSRNPADAPDHILAGMSASEPVIAAVREQQAADWRRFLTLRGTELREGGRLLVGFTASTELGETGWEWLLGELWATLADISQGGVLSADDRTRVTIPIGLRTRDEIRAPFAMVPQFGGLQLVHCDIVKIADPHWEEYERTGDAIALAAQQANTVRAWAGPAIEGRLDPAHDRRALVDLLFAQFQARLAAAPRRHEPYMAIVLLTKT